MEYQKKLYFEKVLPKDIFTKLKNVINYEENSKIIDSYNLAGNIKNEYLIIRIDSEIIQYFEKCAYEFLSETDQTILLDNDVKIRTNLWVNKQKKYEFNPIHKHTGIMSFVCWIQIPYDLQEELNLDNCKNSNTPRNSLFEFLHFDHVGKIQTTPLKVDKSWEGKCIFFDSQLYHQVYPFYTSDDYRISISGNFVLCPKNSKRKLFYS